jgi:hypothetical protein
VLRIAQRAAASAKLDATVHTQQDLKKDESERIRAESASAHGSVRTSLLARRGCCGNGGSGDLWRLGSIASLDAAASYGGAFGHYAAEPYWALIYLGELLGILLMSTAAIALAWRLRRGAGGVWALLGGAAMVIFASVYAIFIAVDGVALGILVDRCAAAGPERQELLYETAFAVRQIEGGLFSIQWLMFGVAAGLYAGAFFASAEKPFRRGWLTVLGWSSAVASIGTLAFAWPRRRPATPTFPWRSRRDSTRVCSGLWPWRSSSTATLSTAPNHTTRLPNGSRENLGGGPLSGVVMAG